MLCLPRAGTAEIIVMTGKPVKSVSVARPWLPPMMSKVELTPVVTEVNQEIHALSVTLSELIAYAHHGNHTRLNLTGRRMVEVAETTAQIDRLVRAAATQNNSNKVKALLSPSN
jgi:hypothetical protein